MFILWLPTGASKVLQNIDWMEWKIFSVDYYCYIASIKKCNEEVLVLWFNNFEFCVISSNSSLNSKYCHSVIVLSVQLS